MHYRLASDKVVGKVLDDEAVIINLDTGMYFGLDGVAAKLWELLSTGIAVDLIAGALKQGFPAEQAIDADVSRFADALCGAGLLVVSDGDVAALPDDLRWPATYQAPVMTAYDDVAEMVALDPPLPELSHQMIGQPPQAR